MDDVDMCFNTLKIEHFPKYQSDMEFIRDNNDNEVTLCPYDMSDSIIYPYTLLEFNFLKPSKHNFRIYDTEAIKNTLSEMRKLDWKEYSKSLPHQLIEKEGNSFGFGDLADVFEESFIALQKLFEKAEKENLYVVSYTDDDEIMKLCGAPDNWEDFM